MLATVLHTPSKSRCLGGANRASGLVLDQDPASEALTSSAFEPGIILVEGHPLPRAGEKKTAEKSTRMFL